MISPGPSLNARFGRIVDIEVRPFAPPPGVQDLADLFGAIRRRPYAMLLLSGGELDCAGYSLMGWDPFLVLQAKGDQVSLTLSRLQPGVPGQPLHRPGRRPGYPGAAGGDAP